MARKEVWRRLTDYPDYEVNSRGHIRHSRSKQKLIQEKGLISGVYKLWHRGDAKKFKGSDLAKQYFPELQGGGRKVEWRQLENFPDYELSEIGIVRNIKTQYDLPILRMSGYDAKVALWRDGERATYSLADLIAETFSKASA